MAKKKKKFGKELKKTLRGARKSKSNKLIYAVAGGLALIVIIAAILIVSGDKKPQDREQLILKSVKYLRKVAFIKDIKVVPQENKIVITFDAETTAGSNKDVTDFRKMARYAGIRVSNNIKDEEIKVLLKEINKKEKDYLVTIKNGEITGEQLLE